MGASLQQRWQDAQPENDAPPGHAAPEQRHCKGLVAVVGQARDVRYQDAHTDKHLVTGIKPRQNESPCCFFGMPAKRASVAPHMLALAWKRHR